MWGCVESEVIRSTDFFLSFRSHSRLLSVMEEVIQNSVAAERLQTIPITVFLVMQTLPV